MDLSEHSDEDLLSSVATLVGSHRELTARLVAHLAEIEDRRLHLLQGFSSMFELCTKELGFSEGEAFRRILAARLARRFPIVYSLLASGSVTLSTLELLREWLTEQNHRELFAVVGKKSKREVQMLLAMRFPLPEAPSRIRRLANIEPLSGDWFKVEFTASDALRRKLELCRDLMSHANPSRDLAVVVERAVDLLLTELEGRRLGKLKRPLTAEPDGTERKSESIGKAKGSERDPCSMTDPRMRATSVVANATRRAVFERDGLRCTFVAENGHRCEARAFLELDHIDPKALGGANGADNLRVRCRAHNQLWAEQAFGREQIERSRHFRQQKSTDGRGETPSNHVDCSRHLRQQKSTNERSETRSNQIELGRHFRQQKSTDGRGGTRSEQPVGRTLEKVRLALRGLGFRDAEARKAVIAVASRHGTDEPLALEQALREALTHATAA
jgi:hypothetical protein